MDDMIKKIEDDDDLVALIKIADRVTIRCCRDSEEQLERIRERLTPEEWAKIEIVEDSDGEHIPGRCIN
jgi:hypothetical protein